MISICCVGFASLDVCLVKQFAISLDVVVECYGSV